ncbi:hypothetical protein HPB47_018927 [Ixodes persulcatus]|uniref:Uncharacterized protein n=1 Tax=Ixodes persulcatus TaxID=34615 RepID=A0AC60QJJ1_IXOPE|nr:hypothetical protein HPB47_018927 [Ixodes persulcatus]
MKAGVNSSLPALPQGNPCASCAHLAYTLSRVPLTVILQTGRGDAWESRRARHTQLSSHPTPTKEKFFWLRKTSVTVLPDDNSP